VEWLGESPEHWEVTRLKNVCEMLVSNVDKHTKPLEQKVRLCNYVDVYKNEFITSAIRFMEATASTDEIKRFAIKIDDVIITKDSEDWLDIGVPALVRFEEKNLVCGYHLAILRPKKFMVGGFLHRILLSQYARTQLSVKANGVTRYGISHGAILGTFIAIPPPSEQTAIAQFLDRKTALIDQAIDIKQKQIELLKERRQILIHQAVTRGLNPEVKMKDSGVEWIGEVPEHWEVTKAKFYSTIFVPERAKPELNTEKEGVPWVTTEHLRKNELFESDVTYFVSDSSRKATGSRIIKSNSVIATCVGNFGIASKLNFDCIINQQVQGFTNLKINADYLTHVIGISEDYFKNNSTLTTIMYVSKDTFGSMPIPLPSDKEQKEIVNYIGILSAKIDTAITLKQQEITKLQEYKATLINSAVTGKIKVGSHAQ
jgi:type I restriction enzyme S subunit